MEQEFLPETRGVQGTQNDTGRTPVPSVEIRGSGSVVYFGGHLEGFFVVADAGFVDRCDILRRAPDRPAASRRPPECIVPPHPVL